MIEGPVVAPPSVARQDIVAGQADARSKQPGHADVDERARRYFADGWWSGTKLLRLCLLVLLHEQPSHGYELRSALESLGFDGAAANTVYRALRWMETLGLVHQRWDVTTLGPARRVYTLSPAGAATLESIAGDARRRIDDIGAPGARRYLAGRLRTISSSKRVFHYRVTTTVLVKAVHSNSAKRKVERLFGRRRELAVGIRTSGSFEFRVAREAVPGET